MIKNLGVMLFIFALSSNSADNSTNALSKNVIEGVVSIWPYPFSLIAGAVYERILNQDFSLQAGLAYEKMIHPGMTWQGVSVRLGSKYMFWHLSKNEFKKGFYINPAVGLGIYQTSEALNRIKEKPSFFADKEAWIPIYIDLGYWHTFKNNFIMFSGLKFQPIMLMIPFYKSNASLFGLTALPRLEIGLGYAF
jgi:hypothetical protein